MEEWAWYIHSIEKDKKVALDTDFRLQIFTEVFADVDGHENSHWDYRLSPSARVPLPENHVPVNRGITPSEQITALPLSEPSRTEFIKRADVVFENTLTHIEPLHIELTRELWNAEFFVDHLLLSEDMLPIDKDYALFLIDAFVPNFAIQVAAEADEIAISSY